MKKPSKRKPAKESAKDGRTVRKVVNQDRFLASLALTGVVAVSCREIGITRAIVSLWNKQDKEFAGKFDNALDESLDWIEAAAHKVSLEGDGPMIRFILSRRRPKVWGEHLEVRAEGATAVVIVPARASSAEEWEKQI